MSTPGVRSPHTYPAWARLMPSGSHQHSAQPMASSVNSVITMASSLCSRSARLSHTPICTTYTYIRATAKRYTSGSERSLAVWYSTPQCLIPRTDLTTPWLMLEPSWSALCLLMRVRLLRTSRTSTRRLAMLAVQTSIFLFTRKKPLRAALITLSALSCFLRDAIPKKITLKQPKNLPMMVSTGILSNAPCL